jgi:hypothetical protein
LAEKKTHLRILKYKISIRLILLLCAALLALPACDVLTGQATTHILFIGNSYTIYNGGIDRQLAGLAPAARTKLIAVGGYTLENHWQEGNALQSIQKGGWDYVVLQEQSQRPVIEQPQFLEFAKDFDAEIRKSGAQTVLLMTWERPDSVVQGVTTTNLQIAYNLIGAKLGAKVAPAGLAFAQALRQRPDLSLYSQDGHPTMYGTYLAACVLYATIFGQSPVGNAYADRSISPELRDFFQRIAAETLGMSKP